ncbi:hypothetical protein A5882_003674 [Enterococcus sp. 4E1_DIV0656]|uniref:hypothetical protein n=1 Tax=Enterococcus sp. 4E1_DIV0656 TaxID=1834180 RepID=UPI000A3BB85C|nr:hypothetical protein [Enterococcus sp. 4E1_DIV0656]OTO08995.1 hypothetical protein A5882_003674 [Enterococcus sp. 4E1_DIV0656]
MEPIVAFTIVMLIWTIGEFVSTKTKALVSMMLVASMIFLIGFAGDFLPHNLIQDSGLLGLGNAVIGIIIVHLGTMMSLEDLKAQWRTFVIGSLTVALMTVVLILVGQLVFDRNIAIAGTASITGGTLSILMVQDKVSELQLAGGDLGILSNYLLAVFPLLILNLKNLVGFLVTANILKKEALRVRGEYRKGNLTFYENEVEENTKTDHKSILPDFLQTPYGTLFMLGVAVYVSRVLSSLTNGYVNTFVIALLLGILLRHFKVLKPNALSSTDSFGLLMISIMVIAFGPLADIVPADLLALVWPIVFYLLAGVGIILLISYIVGKKVGYSVPLSLAIGMTTFFGFPGTMVLTKEAAAAVGETEEEIAVIEQNILPIMVTAGFSTVTITSVITGGLIVGLMIG